MIARSINIDCPRAGFSLVELMVVIVIIGMMTGLAAISWSTLIPSQQFNSAIREFSDVLQGTRSEAIARSRAFRIYYDLDEDTYQVRTPFKEGGGFALTEDDMLYLDAVDLGTLGINLLEVSLDDKVFSDGRVYVEFDPLGASCYHRIILRHELQERDFTLEAMSLTGDIRFHDGIFEREMATEKDFE